MKDLLSKMTYQEKSAALDTGNPPGTPPHTLSHTETHRYARTGPQSQGVLFTSSVHAVSARTFPHQIGAPSAILTRALPRKRPLAQL